MGTALSQNVKNGQQLRIAAAPPAIVAGNLVEIGGLGDQAWPVATIDYAANAAAGSLSDAASIVAAAMPGKSRQPAARDKFGNLYVIGTNSSGRLVAYKYSPLGILLTSAILDSGATSINTAQLHQLSSGNFVCVYARAAGALRQLIFDGMLSVLSGPTAIATEFASTNIVYHASCALSGGGFAVAYQSSAGTQTLLTTYSNAGTVVQAAINIQTLASTVAQQAIKLAQLSSGNLICAFRGTMTAGGTGGTGFVVVTVAGAAVAGPTNLSSVSTLGFVELNVLPGFFAIAVANGTNLIAGIYSNAGAVQGTPFSVGNTLNGVTYPQTKLTNDGTVFVVAWFSSAGFGLYATTLTIAGVSGTAISGAGSATLSATTYALDAEVINGELIALAASSATAGQFWLAIGLPDSNLGTGAPYLRTAPTAIGAVAATAGANWPRVMSGGGGLYQAASGPSNQPAIAPTNGDFTAIFIYDQQTTAATFLAIEKVEASAIMGIALADKALGDSSVLVNPGQGEYTSLAVAGTPGTAFNHLNDAPAGSSGVAYNVGVALSGIAQGGGDSGAASDVGYQLGDYRFLSQPLSVVPNSKWIFPLGQAISRADYAAYFNEVGTTYGAGDASTTFNVPDVRGRVFAGADNLGGSAANILNNGASGGFTGGNSSAGIGTTGGEKSHAQTIAELAAHTHPFLSTVLAEAGSATALQSGNTAPLGLQSATGSTGSGDAANVVQPTIVCNVLLRVKV